MMVPDSPTSIPTKEIATSVSGLTLSPEQRNQVLVEWNRTEAPYPRNACLHHAFEQQAATTPDAPALVVGDERLTYRELNRRANRVAHRLRGLGVGPETLVGIFLTRTVDLVCALLGVLKAGGAYVPLDPVYPADRIAFILHDANVHAVLTQTSLAGTLRGLLGDEAHAGPAIVCVDADPRLAAAPHANPPRTSAPRNLAYVIYTSGSTGRPKGVALEHRNAVSFIHWAGSLYSPRELSGVLAGTSICFDPSILELFVPLSFGGKVILADNALALPSLPAAGEVRLMDTVPSAIRELLRTGSLPASLETINLGGETVPDELVRQLYALPHIRRVYDQYGPTETTTTATCALRDPSEPGTIGRPIANTRTYLLNDQLEPVALGEAGELFIGGAGVARGYLNRPELTRERFIPDPFSDYPDDRLYRTGDVCRYRTDGRLEYVGRRDQQVKINGHRVEPGEIEMVLRNHPGVADAVVVLREVVPGRHRLIAYAMQREATETAAPATATTDRDFLSSLQAHARAHLPHYMVPAFFVRVERFALTASGKIDRQGLPAPTRSSDPRGHQEPRTPTEKAIHAIWSELLGADEIGVHDNFFDIGGDSLAGVSMVERAGKINGEKLPHDTILKAQTIAKLAAIIDGKTSDDAPASLVGVQTRGRLSRLYLVHGIGGGMLWGYANLSRHLGPDQPVYVFTAPELETHAPSPSIADMAARYVDELRRFQPEGPYCLGGYCFGGNIAYEMARLLKAGGQEVMMLALFNCWPSNSSYDRLRWTPVHLFKFLLNLCFWIGRFLRWESGARRDFLQWKFHTLKRKLAACFRMTPGHPESDADTQVNVAGLTESQQRLWRAHAQAIAEHRTGPYEGTVSIFRTRGHPLFCSFDHQCGWGDLAKEVTVRIVPGHHETVMTEPHVGFLARALQSDLAKIAATRPAALMLTVILSVTAVFHARTAPPPLTPFSDDAPAHVDLRTLESDQGERLRTTVMRTRRGRLIQK